jgi:UDP-N-acetyl-2-amino-2-deoxyglucuronate dehydrogenase
MIEKKKIKFGIIGCGRIAHRHAEEILKTGELVAVCDIDKEKAKAFAVNFKTRVYFNHHELLKEESEIDVIAVCTPNGLHAQHSIDALNKNFHVLCEKPMSIDSADAKQMIETAGRNKKYLFVVKQNRFNHAVASVKNALNENKPGKIYSFQLSCFWNRSGGYYKDSWHGKKKLDGGTLFTQFSHFIDILQWFFGDVKEAKAFFANEAHQGIIEFEDTGAVILKMQNGIIGTLNYTVNSYKENMEGSLTIFGEKGTVKIGGQYLNVIQYQNIENSVIENTDQQNPPNDYGFYKGSMSNHDKVYENIIDVLQNGAPVSVNAYDGLRTVEIIEKIYKAGTY